MRINPTTDRVGPRPPFVSQEIEAHPLQFTGQGGEYFRVWIVNVLLTIITLGLYTPWARRRTAQYFYGHTVVAGSPLEFTAQQRRMVVGFLVLLGITVAYQIAANTGQDLVAGLFILGGALLAPFIWGSAMRFRLGNTRWRGLRLQFTARWAEIYRASWPVFAFALIWIVVSYGLHSMWQDIPVDPARGRRLPGQITAPMWGLLVLGLVLSVLCVIRLEYNYRSLLVLRTRLGDEPGRWKPVYMDFVKIWLATVAVFILCAVLLSALVAAAAGGIVAWAAVARSGGFGLFLFLAIIVAFVVGLFMVLVATAPARAYREARMFQLMWDNVGLSRIARFKCQLRTGSYVALRLRNMLFTALTLGFFRPFAMVSEYRMKLESVTLYVKGGLDQVAGRLVEQQRDGIGDALADAAGLDLVG